MGDKKEFQTIVKRDGIDSIMFESMKIASKVSELCEKSETFTQDAFTSFYTHEPKIEGNGPQKSIVETFLNMSEFKDLRASTKSDEIASAMGAVQFAPSLIEKFEEVEEEIEKRKERGEKDGREEYPRGYASRDTASFSWST